VTLIILLGNAYGWETPGIQKQSLVPKGNMFQTKYIVFSNMKTISMVVVQDAVNSKYFTTYLI
jgi:hypothetical protein